MGWRYRRSIRIAPGFRINLSKSGPSLSIGKRGFTTNIGPRGTRTTISIPGTGISYQTSNRRARTSSTSGPRAAGNAASGFVGIGALVVVVLIIYGASQGSSNHSTSVESQSPMSPAQAVTAGPVVQTSSANRPAPQQPNLPGPRDTSTSVKADAPIVLPVDTVPRLPSQVAAVDNAPTKQNVPWRHATPNGVRWSLRQVGGGSLLLVVDLGSGQVANVSVAPAFEALDLPGMNMRVDRIRSFVLLSYPPVTASYSYERDGNIRLLP